MNDEKEIQQEGLMGEAPVSEEKPVEEEVEIPHKAETEEQPTIEPASEDEVLEKPEFLEDKFWDAKEGVKVEDLNNSYKELQKQFSMGKHKAPKEYDLSVFEGIDVEEGVEIPHKTEAQEEQTIEPASEDEVLEKPYSLGALCLPIENCFCSSL